jgi:hypothetical protein
MGWGYADLHAGVNFRFIEFCEVELPIYGVLGSSRGASDGGIMLTMERVTYAEGSGRKEKKRSCTP